MEPNTGVIVASLIFLAVIIAVDRVASVLRDKSRDEADVAKKALEAESFRDMGDKLVQTMQAMHGGVAGDAVRGVMGGMTIDPEGRDASGRVQYQPRDNGQHRGSDTGGFFPPPQPRVAAEQSH